MASKKGYTLALRGASSILSGRNEVRRINTRLIRQRCRRPCNSRMYSSIPDLDQAIPIFAAGRHAEVGKYVQGLLLPDYDVIHLSLSVDEVKADLPRILRGESITPSSKVGSNKDRPHNAQRLPKFLVVGGGFSPEDFDEMQRSVDLTAGGRLSGDDIPVWLKRNPGARGPLELPRGEVTAEIVKFIVGNMRKRLDEAAKEKGLK
ncbi:hypothetical protein TWF696_005786 [Orbilia brochopaga]|uniref:Uncharacterized protein n=1 Tax=Orbilia brochopaga TaxID=3140254 RepID=A0AAV9UVK7_9PEZI